MNRYKSRNK